MTRRSSSCATYFLDGNYFFAVTRTQRSVALSSAESEFIAAVSAIADGIYLKRLLEKVLNHKVLLELRMDSSAARALLKKQGVQRTRHISTGLLWVEDKVAAGEVSVKPVAGQTNPADIGTKRLSAARLKSLMAMLGMFNMSTGMVEGADDPGRIYGKRQNMMAIMSVLSMLHLKGCDDGAAEDLSGFNYGMLVVTTVLGLLFIFLLAT